MHLRARLLLLLASALALVVLVVVLSLSPASGRDGGDYWRDSPLWQEDDKPNINPHRWRRRRSCT